MSAQLTKSQTGFPPAREDFGGALALFEVALASFCFAELLWS